MIRRFLLPLAFLGAVGYAVRASLPDLRRYLKMRAM
jgi:hypothetical protein